MPIFELAIEVVLKREGEAFTDGTVTPIIGRVPRNDPPTKWGITLATLLRARPRATRFDLMALTREGAIEVYRALWWTPLRLSMVVDQLVATKVLDLCVNMGVHGGTELVQECLRELGQNIQVDGAMGSATLAAINAVDPHDLLIEICARQAAHYRWWIGRDPAERERDRAGLAARAAWPFHVKSKEVA